jgi:hypothetical protein
MLTERQPLVGEVSAYCWLERSRVFSATVATAVNLGFRGRSGYFFILVPFFVFLIQQTCAEFLGDSWKAKLCLSQARKMRSMGREGGVRSL